MLNARTVCVVCTLFLLLGCRPLSPMEQKIVGSWSWQYIEGRGRIVFSHFHKVKEGLPPQEEVDRPLHDNDFIYVRSGSWHLEGDVLILEMDNHLQIDRYPPNQSDAPKLKKEVERWTISSIDGKKIVFLDGFSFDREE